MFGGDHRVEHVEAADEQVAVRRRDHLLAILALHSEQTDPIRLARTVTTYRLVLTHQENDRRLRVLLQQLGDVVYLHSDGIVDA